MHLYIVVAISGTGRNGFLDESDGHERPVKVLKSWIIQRAEQSKVTDHGVPVPNQSQQIPCQVVYSFAALAQDQSYSKHSHALKSQ